MYMNSFNLTKTQTKRPCCHGYLRWWLPQRQLGSLDHSKGTVPVLFCFKVSPCPFEVELSSLRTPQSTITKLNALNKQITDSTLRQDTLVHKAN